MYLVGYTESGSIGTAYNTYESNWMVSYNTTIKLKMYNFLCVDIHNFYFLFIK